MNDTPVNQFNMKKEGKNLYAYLRSLLRHSFYNSSEKRNIIVTGKQFEILYESMSRMEKSCYKNRIPFFGHDIIRAGN